MQCFVNRSRTLGLCSAFAFVGLSSAARAGAVDGGGGKSVVCHAEDHRIASAELLDLYEGRLQYRAPALPSHLPVLDQAKQALAFMGAGLEAGFSADLGKEAEGLMKSMVLLPNDVILEPVDDAHNVIFPKTCQLEQLARYTDQHQLLVNGEIWAALDDTNKAALLAHEVIYRHFRFFGAKDSRRARKTVALGFHGIRAQQFDAGLPVRYGLCRSVDFRSIFYAYNNPTGMLVFQFVALDGQAILTRSTIAIDPIPLERMSDANDTYWLTMHSVYDEGLSVSVAFNRDASPPASKTMRIGIRTAPEQPDVAFTCQLTGK